MTVQQPLPAVNPVLSEKLEKLLSFHLRRIEYERSLSEYDKDGNPLPQKTLDFRQGRIECHQLGADVCMELLGRTVRPAPQKPSDGPVDVEDDLIARYAERSQELTPEMRERVDKLRHRASSSNIMEIFDAFSEPLSVDVIWMEYHLRFRKGIPRPAISDKLSRMITGENALLEPVPELGRGHYRKRAQRRLKVVR